MIFIQHFAFFTPKNIILKLHTNSHIQPAIYLNTYIMFGFLWFSRHYKMLPDLLKSPVLRFPAFFENYPDSFHRNFKVLQYFCIDFFCLEEHLFGEVVVTIISYSASKLSRSRQTVLLMNTQFAP